MTHSRLIQKALHLSDTASNTFDATVLLHFIQFFKTLIWKRYCANQAKWEKDHNIRHHQKRTNGLDHETMVANDDSHISISSPISRVNTQNEQIVRANDTHLHIQVLDDIDSPIPSLPIQRTIRQSAMDRKMEAAHMAWQDMTIYVKHNFTAVWILKLTKYFNKFTKLSDDLWDRSVDLGDT